MTKYTFKKGFSLIELSIVVLIIGILIAGVTQGSRLVRQSRIKSAQAQTNSSAIGSIPGLAAWFETSLDNNIISASNSDAPEDRDNIFAWKDINPQGINRIIVKNATSINQPTYVVNGIGNLPSISFGGSQWLGAVLASGDNIPLDAATSALTYVVVWQADNTSNPSDIIDQSYITSSTSRRAGIVLNSTGGATAPYGLIGSTGFNLTATYAARVPMATIMTLSSTGNVTIYDNNTNAPNSPYSGTVTPLTNLSNALFYVGAVASTQASGTFTGLISEIIIFNRALKASEIKDVKLYLAKKYNITIF